MPRKSHTIKSPLSKGGVTVIAASKVVEFNARIKVEMKGVSREFQKNQITSLEKATGIVLNA